MNNDSGFMEEIYYIIRMKGGRTRKNSSRSVMGRLLPPIDIKSEDKLNELNRRISIGPVTLVFVYADWCGHCQRFKPEMDKLEKTPGRSVQIARINDEMLPKSMISKNKISGYPSLMLIKKNGEATVFQDDNGEITNTIPEYNDLNKMKTIIRNAGTNEGVSLLEDVSPDNSGSQEPTNVVSDRQVEPTQKQQGGMMGLWSHLLAVSQNIAPAAALFLGAELMKKKGRKTRSKRR